MRSYTAAAAVIHRCFPSIHLHLICSVRWCSILFDRVRWYSSLVGKMRSLKHLKKMLLREGVPVDHIFTHTLAQGVTYRWVIAWTFNAEAAARVRSTSTKEMIAAVMHQTRGPEREGVEEEGGSVVLEEAALSLSALLTTTLSKDLLSLRGFVDERNQLDATAREVNQHRHRQCKVAMDRLLLLVVADAHSSTVDDLQSSLSDLLQLDPISIGAALMIARIHSAVGDVGSTRGCCSGTSSDDATQKQLLTVTGGDKQQSVELCCELITWAALSEAGHWRVRYEVVIMSGGGGGSTTAMDRVSQTLEVHLWITIKKEEEKGVVDTSSSCGAVALPVIRLAVSMIPTSSSAASGDITCSNHK